MDKKKKKLTLALVEERLGQLPLLPAVVCDLMAMDQESSEFFEKATQLAESDPPLAARVLAYANSAAAAPTEPIVSIQKSMVRVGVAKILHLITAMSVLRVFTPSTDQQKAMWQHALETALIARFIAQQMPSLRVDREQAYACGLLHDIGRFALFEITSKAVDMIDAQGWDTPIELPEVEQKMLGFTHAEVGEIAATKWGLPESMVQVLKLHHSYDIWQHSQPEALKNLVLIVQFSDLVSVVIEKNPEWPDWDEAALRDCLTKQCQHKDWPQVVFPIPILAEELPSIAVECFQLMESLKIA